MPRFIYAALLVTACLYLPYLPLHLSSHTGMDIPHFSVVPGWLIWLAIPSNQMWQIIAAGIITLCMLVPLAWMASRGVGFAVAAAAIALLLSVLPAIILRSFQEIPGI
jgi:hypothetical protein